ncbi:MAG: hypothetical protein Q9190_004847 [Brigantiaea leucoxantha]
MTDPSAQLLLFSVTMPTYVLLLAAKITQPQPIDVGFTQVLLALVFLAFVADQQQWDFQQAKKEYQRTARVPRTFKRGSRDDLDRGFLVSGLWKWSRHPNFAAEQSFWVVLYFWSCWTSQTYFNWTGVGALGYLALFQASTWFTELITAKKYREYNEYQKRVGKFLPNLIARQPGDFSDTKATGSKRKPRPRWPGVGSGLFGQGAAPQPTRVLDAVNKKIYPLRCQGNFE